MNISKTTMALMLALPLLCACQNAAQVAGDTRLYESGASRELADQRKRKIKDLRYTLRFDLPEERRKPVTGEETIRLRLDGRQELLLDFKASPTAVRSMHVNGGTTACDLRNEHIIIPADKTRKGENEIRISFTAGDQSLNRRDDYMYTLVVPDRARTLFPCFDQPNLKAVFTLTLGVPAGWQAVSNTYVADERTRGGRKVVSFAPTEPLSTYLFSFVAGRLHRKDYADGERRISAYYRETDPAKVAQLDTIFRQVSAALRWQEEYTGMKYPFAKYDIIIVPGFQFGGMEHTGATLYNDTQLFLNANATPDEELARAALIAHETSHMWFGDLVTMDWFDDVWTKEVFANYYAARITEPLFPGINHSLNWMKTYAAAALSEDRTPGNTAIRQTLGNMKDAGLVYNQIVYNKAPVMMKKIVELMGEDAFRDGIREYLSTYAYGNATWDDLVRILDRKTNCDLKAFSDVWVNEKGMPTVTFSLGGRQLTVAQHDPDGRGLVWPQRFNVTVQGQQRDTTFEVSIADSVHTVELSFTPQRVLPNTDGRGYGLFVPDSASRQWMLAHWHETKDDATRQAILMLLHENYQAKLIGDEPWADALLRGLACERNPLVASTVTGCLAMPMRLLPDEKRSAVEAWLLVQSTTHPLPSCRTALLRLLTTEAHGEATIDSLYAIWKGQTTDLLGENDYTNLAYELAVRKPAECSDILAEQRKRISNPDRLRQFNFISPAAVADTTRLDSVFRSLSQAENRRTEPWAVASLRLLCHPARGTYAVKHIRPALELMSEVQRTGDIFFPRNWAGALLARRTDRAAYGEVSTFLNDNPDFPTMLRSKVLQAAYPLYRLYE